MFNKETRKGVSLGSILALLASTLFVGVSAPAQASETAPVVNPVVGTSYTMLITEDFQLKTRLGSSMDASLISKLTYKIEKTGGLNGVALSISSQPSIGELGSSSISNWTHSTGLENSLSSMVNTATLSYMAASGATVDADNVLAILPYSSSTITSTSASITVYVTAFIDSNQNGVHDVGEPASDRKTITFVPWSSMGATVAVSALNAGDTKLTVSSVIPDTVNKEQLTGSFIIAGWSPGTAGAAYINATSKSSAVTGGLLSQKATNYVSHSANITGGVPSGATSYSAHLYYIPDGSTLAVTDVVATTTIASGEESVGVMSIAPVVGANITDDEKVRPNQTYTIKVHAKTGSTSVSNAVLNVAMSGTALSLGAKEISINGGASTTSYPTALAITTGADGYASFTVRTIGFVNEETFTVTVTRNAVTAKSLTFTTYDPVYTVTDNSAYYAVAPGTAVVTSYQVKDQWGELSARTDQRLKIVRASTTGFNYSETTSYVAVSAGAASFTYTGQPATASGSTTLAVTLQRENSNNGVYIADSGSTGVTSNINVTSTARAFGTGLATSYSASVSYFPSTVSWISVTGLVANTGSAIAVSGDGLIFRVSSAVAKTYSGAITVNADGSLGYAFQVASLTAGSKTMTLVNGTATTTSLIVIDAVGDEGGANISFDVTNIVPGKTAIVTGTVTDANGNPVDTTINPGDATIVVTYTGTAGIPVGTMPTETDANGEFKISLLTSAADQGSMTLTATYNKDGASTAAADKLTKAHVITVGAAAASADQKVNAGSFKGYVAIYAKGYEGQRLSAKVGNDWVVVASLASNFERVVEYTGAGYTIAVRIYIDRVLVDTITVTTK